ncbi:MAG: recombinase family protein, partial [Gemmatimonadales bacterium]
MAKRIRAYCRVSTDLQYDGGVSLDVQETRISALCVAQGHTLVKIYKDVGSGKNMERPQLKILLEEIQPGETICILDLSRLSRSAKDTLNMVDDLDKRGIGIISVTENIDTTSPQGRFMMTMVSALNQMERESTALKVKQTMAVLSDQGKLRGKPPFGWRFAGKDKDFEPVPQQQLVLDKIKKLYTEGVKMNGIATILNNDGDNRCLCENKKHPEKFRNSVFHQTTVKRILVEHNLIEGTNSNHKSIEEKIASHHKPIVDANSDIKP